MKGAYRGAADHAAAGGPGLPCWLSFDMVARATTVSSERTPLTETVTWSPAFRVTKGVRSATNWPTSGAPLLTERIDLSFGWRWV